MTMIDAPMLLFRQLGHLQLTFNVISSCCIRSQWNASLESPPDIIVTVPPIYQMAVHWKSNLSGHFYAQIDILGFGREHRVACGGRRLMNTSLKSACNYVETCQEERRKVILYKDGWSNDDITHWLASTRSVA